MKNSQTVTLTRDEMANILYAYFLAHGIINKESKYTKMGVTRLPEGGYECVVFSEEDKPIPKKETKETKETIEKKEEKKDIRMIRAEE